MLLGKRQRPPMKRTTSMSEFGMDLNVDGSTPENSKERQKHAQDAYRRSLAPDGADFRFPAIVSPRNSGSNSGGSIKTAHFLQACNLCQRRLGPGRDIYMYRGDSAFCSLECRQQQINLDERKQKCALSSMKKESPPAKGTEKSSNGETVAAA